MIAAQSTYRIFRWPAAIGAASLIGLLSALVGDGAWDGLSWLLLALPVMVGAAAARPDRNGRARKGNT